MRNKNRYTPLERDFLTGYTLLEVLFVVVVIAILAGIAVPRLGVTSSKKMKAKTAAQRIVSDLRLTRRLAISNNEDYKLIVYPSSNEYKIFNSTNVQHREIRSIDSDVTTSGDTTFIFESLGNASASSGTSLSLSAAGSQYNITVTIATGMVSMEEQ